MPKSTLDLCRLLRDNPYPGRGLVMGLDPSGDKALQAYFIMGRSENSRNRVFFEQDGELRIRLHQARSAGDTDLILYRPTATRGRQLIVTNGDQTDTILAAVRRGGSFESALRGRSFEPDAPHFTPRISGMMILRPDGLQSSLSILRAADSQGSACDRLFFEYPGLPGQGRFLHRRAPRGRHSRGHRGFRQRHLGQPERGQPRGALGARGQPEGRHAGKLSV
jgi:hypothetical protein